MNPVASGPRVVAVHAGATHDFSKPGRDAIELVTGHGVRGDAHAGVTVQHRSRVARDASQPNLRQVHLIHAELFAELREVAFEIGPGELGENITTLGIDLLGLPRGALLRFGSEAVVEVTGLRNPCAQLDRYRLGLMAATLGRDADGALARKAGVMGIVRSGGIVTAGDAIDIEYPAAVRRLEPV